MRFLRTRLSKDQRNVCISGIFVKNSLDGDNFIPLLFIRF